MQKMTPGQGAPAGTIVEHTCVEENRPHLCPRRPIHEDQTLCNVVCDYGSHTVLGLQQLGPAIGALNAGDKRRR